LEAGRWNWNFRHGPVGLAAKGNAGVVELVARNQYSIGYSELTYAIHNHLLYGNVANRSGRFIQANLASVTAAAAGAIDDLPADFRVSITDPPGPDAYPISSFTWMLLPSVITDSTKQAALIKFVRWGLARGQDYLEPLSYARLPSIVIDREEKALDTIKLSNRGEAFRLALWSSPGAAIR
jgi:phosphate transport system substrate-binding protein